MVKVIGTIRYIYEREVNEEFDSIDEAESAISIQQSDPLNSQFGKASELSEPVSADVNLRIE